jgi:hypothetical protein
MGNREVVRLEPPDSDRHVDDPDARAAEIEAEVQSINHAIAALAKRKGVALREYRRMLAKIAERARRLRR